MYARYANQRFLTVFNNNKPTGFDLLCAGKLSVPAYKLYASLADDTEIIRGTRFAFYSITYALKLGCKQDDITAGFNELVSAGYITLAEGTTNEYVFTPNSSCAKKGVTNYIMTTNTPRYINTLVVHSRHRVRLDILADLSNLSRQLIGVILQTKHGKTLSYTIASLAEYLNADRTQVQKALTELRRNGYIVSFNGQEHFCTVPYTGLLFDSVEWHLVFCDQYPAKPNISRVTDEPSVLDEIPDTYFVDENGEIIM